MKINYREILLTPNLISLFRLFLFIPFSYYFHEISANSNSRYYIFILILIAFLSDILDGFVARKTNKVSELGKIIDPLADKVLVALIIINLFLMGEIPSYYFWTVVLRDVLIFIGGFFISNKIGKVLPSNLLGKLTVFSIGIFIMVTILQVDKSNFYYKIIMLISMMMCFASLAGYTIRAIEIIKWKKNGNTF